jgi:hypothetical protein
MVRRHEAAWQTMYGMEPGTRSLSQSRQIPVTRGLINDDDDDDDDDEYDK